MGTILFYIFESTLCLTILYFLFRLFFRKDTLFRTNRFLLLAGTMACTLLPLLQIDVPQYTTLQLPITTVRHLLTEKEIDVQREGGTGEKHLSEEASLLMAEKGEGIEGDRVNVIHTIPVIWLLGGCYFIGALIVLAFLLLSTIRMRRLIRSYPACNYGKYKLVICPEKMVSFSWGHTIVLSQEDYERNPGEILLHEQMHLQHRHTLDLLWMECIVIFHWFNPAAWLLMRELREVHEYEADNGVINNGIDATEYQLLLLKKSVGTRLYSMANGFNHSKLKKRITMMLKERTNRWARLKLLLAVPVMAGALYVFAQPEVKEVPRQIQSELQQKEADDYSSLMFFFKEGGERYSKLVNGAYPPSKIKARQVHSLFVNKQNRVMFDNDVCSVDELKSTIVKNLTKSWEESKRKEYQVISFQVDRGSEIAALTTILKEVKGAFEQIRADLSITLTDKSEEALDRLFPVLLSEGATRNYGLKELSMEEKISGIVVTIHTSEGKEVMKDYTLTELKQKVTAARAKQAADPESLVIGLKIEKGCKMGYVTDTKQVLRECSALKINYSTDN